jgi:hypothetical protein
VGSSGVECRAAITDLYFSGQGSPAYYVGIAGPDQFSRVDRWTGQVATSWPFTNLPPGYTVHALWGSSPLYAILGADNASSLFGTIDSLHFTLIGSTGRGDLEALALGPAQSLLALGTDNGGTLCQINPATGAATVIGGGGFGDARAMTTLAGGAIVAAGSNLLSVDPATGATTLIGPTGYSDIRGLVFMSPCYADCQAGGPPPILNVLDFTCFLNRFAAGHPYANCDQSTTPPVLNVADFLCFMNAFASAAGCG